MTHNDRNPAPTNVGERHVQNLLGTSERASRFYRDQMLDHLNPAMRDFVSEQEMLFIATSVPFILLNDWYSNRLRKREQSGGMV